MFYGVVKNLKAKILNFVEKTAADVRFGKNF